MRLFFQNRIGLVALSWTLAVAPLVALAQNPKPEPKPSDPKPPEEPAKLLPAVDGKSLFREAFGLTKDAKTIDDYSKIIALSEQGLAVEPDPKEVEYGKQLAAWAYNRRGEAHAEAEKPNDKAALADFEEAVRHDNTKYKYFHNRGVSYGIAGELEKAQEDFEHCIRLERGFEKAYFNLGEVLFALGKPDEAIRNYTRAVEIDPNDSDAYNARGFAYYETAKYRSAVEDFNRALQANSKNFKALTNRGIVYGDRGYHEQSIKDFQAAIEANPNFGPAYHAAAWFRATCPAERFRRADLALRSAEKAIELDGESARYLDVLAAAQARSGEFEKAVQTQQRAIEMANAEQMPKEKIELYNARLERYKNNKAWVDLAPGTPQPD